ncbi:MAG: phosphoribosyl-ATP diphosphatase [Candidatus Margulisiibacteriota bacterium]|jgi:phosphoribosyl-ATP pyrophosphohydrolase/phosphoribosyl-AMP cyclohydrolase
MYDFLKDLEVIIEERKQNLPADSYTTKIFKEGLNRILQKVGEEAVELVIAGKNQDTVEIKNECADLIFHLLIFLHSQNLNLTDIVAVLEKRHKK